MDLQTKFETDLTVRSFAYVAKRLAHSLAMLSPSALYEQILGEAEKHSSALRLVQRDVLNMLEFERRKGQLSDTEILRLREYTEHTVSQAKQAIDLIASQYAPQKLAA